MFHEHFCADQHPEYLTSTPIEGNTLRVHLWDTSGDQPKFLHCNCTNQASHTTQGDPTRDIKLRDMALTGGWNVASVPPGVNSCQADRNTYPMAPQYAAQPVASFGVAPGPARNEADMQQALAAFAAMQLNPQDPRYAWVQQYQFQQASQAQGVQQATDSMANRYVTSMNGLPVSTDRGAMRTEFRGLFVSGINYKARTKDIQAIFSKAGEITKCEVQKHPASGKSKGKATIQYRSAADAQKAIQMFDRKAYLGMELRVRFDTEPTVISAPPAASSKTAIAGQPVIVTVSMSGKIVVVDDTDRC